MDYRLLYSETALAELSEILGYIAEDDGEAAENFGNSLIDHIELLKQFPRLGPIVKKRSPVRKLTHSPVCIYYVVSDFDRQVDVLRIRHGSRKSPRF